MPFPVCVLRGAFFLFQVVWWGEKKGARPALVFVKPPKKTKRIPFQPGRRFFFSRPFSGTGGFFFGLSPVPVVFFGRALSHTRPALAPGCCCASRFFLWTRPRVCVFSFYIMAAPSDQETRLVAYETDVIRFALELMSLLNLKQKRVWLPIGRFDARFDRDDSGNWSASTWRKDGVLLGMFDYGEDESVDAVMEIYFGGDSGSLTFLPPHHDATTDLPLVELVVELFEKIRDEDTNIRAHELHAAFARLARSSGYEQTLAFLKKVDKGLGERVGREVNIDDRGIEDDGQGLYRHPEKDLVLIDVSKRVLSTFRFATGVARMASMAVYVCDADKQTTFLSILDSYGRPNMDRDTETNAAKRSAGRAAPGENDAKKRRSSESDGSHVAQINGLL